MPSNINKFSVSFQGQISRTLNFFLFQGNLGSVSGQNKSFSFQEYFGSLSFQGQIESLFFLISKTDWTFYDSRSDKVFHFKGFRLEVFIRNRIEVFHQNGSILFQGKTAGVKRRMDLVLFYHISTKFLFFATLLL